MEEAIIIISNKRESLVQDLMVYIETCSNDESNEYVKAIRTLDELLKTMSDN